MDIVFQSIFHLYIAIRLALGVVFVFAGIGKLLHPGKFIAGVIEYTILPKPLARWYGRILPFTEMIAGLLLLLGIFTQAVSFITALMLLSFMIAVGINLKRKREMPCFCFGADATDKMGWQTVVRILVLLLLTIILTFNTLSLPALWQIFDSAFFASRTEMLPVAMVSASLLIFLSLIDIAPWSIRAWTSPGIRANPQGMRVVWRRVFETEENS